MNSSYIILDYNIAPDVFKKVVETKNLIASGKCKSVNEAISQTGLSRTAFYKYKDHIYSYTDNVNNNIVTLAFTLEDVTGVLSNILSLFAQLGIGVLTINQNIPINGVANITISLRLNDSFDTHGIIGKLKQIEGVNKVHLLAMS